ncbi:pyridoxal phosphate-dependent aminotransferase [Sanyastnella coralliicola]|uniref:pyridoxal phosphate-dependent aminotransferase n=1 Tax=Sanyastnella coralliicola TaxID=3069118 RepID=UPI0027B9C765|nr:pyridoxal phosphate-dependent aminotransferase [Longitalea sp. SCSIO 12813]
MPGVSQKGMAMPASPIRKLVPYAEAAKKAGTKVFHLNIGQPDIETPQVVRDAVRAYDETVLAYSLSEGNLSYREGLSAYYQKHDIPVNVEDILITTGGSEALSFVFNACMDAGDEVIIPEPFYANYNGFAQAAGVTVQSVTAKIEDGFALPAIEEFEPLINGKTRAILICNPANPTGYLYSREELEKLRALALEHDLFLIADEVYREFCYHGEKPTSVMNLDGLDQHVILIDSVSKRYSMCGARIGAMITKNEEVRNTALKFAQARLSPPSLAQLAGEAALQTPQSYFDEVIEEYVERRNVLVDGLNAIPGVRCPKPKGAFYCMAELPVDDAEKFCQWLLESFSHNGNTVMMAPAAGFYKNAETGRKQVRVAYVLNVEELKQAVDCLRAALDAYPGKVEQTNVAHAE